MRMSVEIGESQDRVARVEIDPEELGRVLLHVTSPDERRPDRFMRRHGFDQSNQRVDPNHPLRSPEEPPKWPIADHLRQLHREGRIAAPTPVPGRRYSREPARLVVPISDLVANLLRPCFHRDGLGSARIFSFDGEPLDRKTYTCVSWFEEESGRGALRIHPVVFDRRADTVYAPCAPGITLESLGLVWAAALVPLVVDGEPLSAREIAREDYDLRQILGRDADALIQQAYEGWFDEWDERVDEAVAALEAASGSFACFYHSVIALDRHGRVLIVQREATLPELARTLAADGIFQAGLLDSGGSCAVYDAWAESYINHNWYYREPRGAILLFELTHHLNVPDAERDSWRLRRDGVQRTAAQASEIRERDHPPPASIEKSKFA